MEKRRISTDELHARQSALITQILSLRWRKLKQIATKDELRQLKRVEAQFDANVVKLKRRKAKNAKLWESTG